MSLREPRRFGHSSWLRIRDQPASFPRQCAVKPPITLSLQDPSQWPLRMTRDEVAYVLRRSRRWVEHRVRSGQIPGCDSDFMWDRDTVARYAKGGIKQLDALKDREARVAAVKAAIQKPRRQFLKAHRLKAVR